MPVFAIGLVLTSGHYKKQIYFTDSQFEQVKLMWTPEALSRIRCSN